MASLRSMILDGRVATATKDKTNLSVFSRLAKLTRQCLESRDTVLVNVTSVYEDLAENRAKEEPGDPELSQIPAPKPPFRQMWLEVVQDSRHVGVLVSRAEITSRDDLDAVLETLPRWPAEYAEEIQARMPASIVYGVMWQDWQGAAELRGELAYHLDAEGYYQRSAFWPFVEPGYEDQETDDVPWRQIMVTLYTGTVTTLHAFARMNCHNVTLVPMAAGAPRLKKGKRHPPFSVWHEIAVTGLPQLRREQGGGLPDGEKRELRFHKVRGHYADYTKGKGLFGRLKVRIWIEEHAAGRSELGTVAGSYRIE